MNLKNKKIIITGASGGIGHSLVKKFSEFDSTVLATGTNIEKLNNLKKEFPKIKIKQFQLDQHDKIEEFLDNCFTDLSGMDVIINKVFSSTLKLLLPHTGQRKDFSFGDSVPPSGSSLSR